MTNFDKTKPYNSLSNNTPKEDIQINSYSLKDDDG